MSGAFKTQPALTLREAAERAEALFNSRWPASPPKVKQHPKPRPKVELGTLSISIATAVGTYDGNGNKKGSGW